MSKLYCVTPALPALMVQRDSGIARVCSYHNDIVPRSVQAADAFALFNGLKVSHGVCPACALRISNEIKQAREQQAAGTRVSNLTYAMQRSGVL